MMLLSQGRWNRQARQIFCLFLVVLTLAAALHTHIDSSVKAERHCSVCVALHSALPKLAHVGVSHQPASSEDLKSDQEVLATRLLFCGLYVRPPPASV
jgi:hypothetical protein